MGGIRNFAGVNERKEIMVVGIIVVVAVVVLVLQSVFEKDESGKSAWQRGKRKRKTRNDPRVKRYKELLDSYYRCEKPYSIEVCNCKPKKYMGLYFPGDAIIRIYAGWQKYHSLEEIALHEYAHHIQYTEYPETIDPDEWHNDMFWKILDDLKNRRLNVVL